MNIILYLFTRREIKVVSSNYRGISPLLTTYKIVSNILASRLNPYAEEIIGIISVDFDITDQPLIKYSAFLR
jgi:hypothetical protein